MLKVQVLDKGGKKVSELNAAKEVFGFPVKEHLLYETVISYRANQRRGTASTKTRAMVRGGGRKPWRQKGTGRARAGSTRSPLWRSGGITFGPTPRSYTIHMPKKAKKNALKSALSTKLEDKQIVVLDDLKFKQPKTKEGVELLKNLKMDSALIVDKHDNKNLFLSMRNIPKVKTVDVDQVNVYDVLNYKWLVLTKTAFESLMEKLK